RDAGRELADPLGMAPGVRIACIHCLREGGCGAVARSFVGSSGEPLELGELDDVGTVEPHPVLAVLLRPVQRAVRQSDQLVAPVTLDGEGREAGADGDASNVIELDSRASR